MDAGMGDGIIVKRCGLRQWSKKLGSSSSRELVSQQPVPQQFGNAPVALRRMDRVRLSTAKGRKGERGEGRKEDRKKGREEKRKKTKKGNKKM